MTAVELLGLCLLLAAVPLGIGFPMVDTARRPRCDCCYGRARTLYQRVANVCDQCGGTLPWDEP